MRVPPQHGADRPLRQDEPHPRRHVPLRVRPVMSDDHHEVDLLAARGLHDAISGLACLHVASGFIQRPEGASASVWDPLEPFINMDASYGSRS